MGLVERMVSRCLINFFVESARLGMKLGMWPLGTWCSATERRIRQNWVSPTPHDEGGSS